jgi:MFS family permease
MEGLPEAAENSNLYRTILLAAGTYHFGYFVGIFNPLAEPLLTHIYKIKGESEIARIEGNINMCFTVGAMLSVLVSGKLADSLGRVKLLTYLELLSIVTYILYSVESLNVLLCARFLSGVISS